MLRVFKIRCKLNFLSGTVLQFTPFYNTFFAAKNVEYFWNYVFKIIFTVLFLINKLVVNYILNNCNPRWIEYYIKKIILCQKGNRPRNKKRRPFQKSVLTSPYLYGWTRKKVAIYNQSLASSTKILWKKSCQLQRQICGARVNCQG